MNTSFVFNVRTFAVFLFLTSITLTKNPTLSQAQEGTEISPHLPIDSEYVPQGYQLVWNDEFEAEGLDTTKWKYRYPNRSYGAGIISETAVVQPGDGYLHLSTSYQDPNFLTGMVQSLEQFQYGYFEARIQFQSLQGHHGAFWLQSDEYGQFLDDPGRSGTEIDIIEFFGNERSEEDAQHNVYWNAYNTPDLEKRTYEIFYRQDNDAELSEDFHSFALLWTPDEYIFYIDGVETWRLTEGISHVEEYIVLSLTTSNWENPLLDPQKLPDEMLIDYVRVYSR